MKSVEYRIGLWSFNKYKGNYDQLYKVKDILIKLEK